MYLVGGADGGRCRQMVGDGFERGGSGIEGMAVQSEDLDR